MLAAGSKSGGPMPAPPSASAAARGRGSVGQKRAPRIAPRLKPAYATRCASSSGSSASASSARPRSATACRENSLHSAIVSACGGSHGGRGHAEELFAQLRGGTLAVEREIDRRDRDAALHPRQSRRVEVLRVLRASRTVLQQHQREGSVPFGGEQQQPRYAIAATRVLEAARAQRRSVGGRRSARGPQRDGFGHGAQSTAVPKQGRGGTETKRAKEERASAEPLARSGDPSRRRASWRAIPCGRGTGATSPRPRSSITGARSPGSSGVRCGGAGRAGAARRRGRWRRHPRGVPVARSTRRPRAGPARARRRAKPFSTSSSPSGTRLGMRFLKRPATVRRVSPNTHAPNGASPRKESIDANTLTKTSWTVSSVSARFRKRRATKWKMRAK